MVKPHFYMDRIEFLLVGLKLIPHLKLIEVHGFIASNTFKPVQFFIFPKVVILLRPGCSCNSPYEEEYKKEERTTCQRT